MSSLKNSATERCREGLIVKPKSEGKYEAYCILNIPLRSFARSACERMTLAKNEVVNYRGQNVRIVNNWQQTCFRDSANYSAFYNYSFCALGVAAIPSVLPAMHPGSNAGTLNKCKPQKV
jgi:hypothetical protein